MYLHIIVLAVYLCLTAATATAESPLFSYLPADGISARSTERAVISRRSIRLNSSALSQDFSIDLPQGESMNIALKNKRTRSGKFTTEEIFGESKKKKGFVQLSSTTDLKGQSAVNGIIRTDSGSLYLIRQRAPSSQELIQIDESRQIECDGAAHLPEYAALAENLSLEAPIKTQATSTINLLIAYTPDAVTEAGSEAAVLSVINNMVASANLAHTNSGTGVMYAIAATYALSEASNDDFAQELSEATDDTDGKWDELGALREQYCADQVVVIVGGTNNQTICGIAWLGGDAATMPFYDAQMYSVVSVNQVICSSLTFAHELAHNLGSEHDFNNSSQNAPYPYSYGHRFVGDSGKQYRTVMAYSPGTRIAYFSNPDVSYEGQPTGTVTANNALSILQTAPVVAEFYGSGAACLTNPPPVVPTALPTTAPATQVDRITLTAKVEDRKATFKVRTLAGKVGVGALPVTIYFDKKGTTGFTQAFAQGVTNIKGVKKFNKRKKRGYFLACHNNICSAAKKL